jgi:hypothetical protein
MTAPAVSENDRLDGLVARLERAVTAIERGTQAP